MHLLSLNKFCTMTYRFDESIPLFRFFFTALIGALCLCALSAPVEAQQRPLLMENKTVLYQRVLTRPSTQIWPSPGDTTQPAQEAPPFAPFYVYKRDVVNQEEWLQVGTDSTGAVSGWLPAASAIEWKHAISVAFSNPANRERLPFFRNSIDLEKLIADENVIPKTQNVVDDLNSGLVGPDYPAIALEPETHVDMQENFYLLPILEFSDALSYNFLEVRMLKVASASEREELAPTPSNLVVNPPAQQTTQSTANSPHTQLATNSSQNTSPATQLAAPVPQQQPSTIQQPQSARPAVTQQVQGVSASQITNVPSQPQVAVANIVAGTGPASVAPAMNVQANAKTGIAFVIDTTSSMGPYIESLRDVVTRLNEVLSTNGVLQDTAFALIGFRDNTQAAPSLEYVSQVFADFQEGKTPDDFLRLANTVSAASTSSQNFNEDVYAGLLDSIKGLDWSPFAGRFVILIGDAGPRIASDPLSQTQMGAEQLRELAKSKGIAVMAIHLKTPPGRNNHEQAEQEYLNLTENENAGVLYYPINAGDVQQFDSMLEEVSLMLVDLINVVSLQKMVPAKSTVPSNTPQTPTANSQAVVTAPAKLSSQAPQVQQTPQNQINSQVVAATKIPAAPATQQVAASQPASPVAAAPTQDPAKVKFFDALENVGLAMRLAYLGRLRGEVPPSLFEAWVADRDLINPKKKAIDVRLLLTKAQLSDLQDALKTIVREGQMGQIAPDQFFNRLKSASAALSTDPARFKSSQFQTIGDIDILNELLGDLPYKSKVMNISQRDWLSFSIGEQEEFISNLISKIRLYQEFHDDVDRWVDFDGQLTANEALYPIPLDVLP